MALYEVGMLRRNEMEDSVFIKTENAFGKICFWFHISNFWEKQKQKIPVYGGFRTRPICLNSFLGLTMGPAEVGELRGLFGTQIILKEYCSSVMIRKC